MAKTKISEYSSTSAGANLNTDINTIDIDEGCAPSGINNAIRTLMAQLKDFQTGVSGDGLTLGGALSGTSATFSGNVTASAISGASLTLSGNITASAISGASMTLSGDLTVDTNTLYVDTTNNRVGIGTNSPSTLLHVQGSNSGGNIVAATLRNNNAVDSTQTSLRFTNSTSDGTSGGGELSYLRNAGNQGSSFIVKTQSSVGVNTERMRIDSSGNVLVGKTSADYTVVGFESTPNSVFQANAMTGDGVKPLLMARNTNDGELIQFRRGTTQVGAIGAVNGGIYFGSGASSTERMRIDSGGGIFFGKTTTAETTAGWYLSPGAGNVGLSSGNYFVMNYVPGGASTMIDFRTGGVSKGNISQNGTNTAYNTSSDYRLKENVAPMSGSINRLKQLKPSTWSWVQDGSHGEGFLAHEAQTVVPEAVTGTKDAMKTEEYEVTPAVLDDNGNVVTEAVMGTREVPDYQGIDQSKLVPLLTAALQEAITKIEALETRIQTLENK